MYQVIAWYSVIGCATIVCETGDHDAAYRIASKYRRINRPYACIVNDNN